jgi:carboxymethylenebutenolidase
MMMKKDDAALPARRGFLTTTLGTGFALAVQPALAQQAVAQSVIHTDAAGLLAGEVKIAVPGGEMVAYRARPAKAARALPVVLVVSEIFGVHEHIADVCRRLAKLGYLALAPELFARQGDPRALASPQEIIAQIVSRVPDAQVMADLDACVAWATRVGGDAAGDEVVSGDAARVAITGFCWGGRVTWLYAAHSASLRAGVAWYGRLDGLPTPEQPSYPIDRVSALKAPVLGLYGGQDQGIPMSDVEDMQRALTAHSAPSQIHVYPEAPHAFHADYRPSYRAESAHDGWQRMLAWFRQHGV